LDEVPGQQVDSPDNVNFGAPQADGAASQAQPQNYYRPKEADPNEVG